MVDRRKAEQGKPLEVGVLEEKIMLLTCVRATFVVYNRRDARRL
jgi:hypothetical protein